MACGSCPDNGRDPVEEELAFMVFLRNFFGEGAGCQVGSISFDSSQKLLLQSVSGLGQLFH